MRFADREGDLIADMWGDWENQCGNVDKLKNRNHKLEISTVPTKAKSDEPAYSQMLSQNKIDRQRVKIQKIRQADNQTAVVDGVYNWDSEGASWR